MRSRDLTDVARRRWERGFTFIELLVDSKAEGTALDGTKYKDW